MSIDGSMLAAIKHDLKQALVGGRIDKIYQPEQRLLTFTIRNHGQNQRLLISVHPQRPRIHLTRLDFENPDHPPAYCMLLRKYLIHGNIIGIKQPEFERVLYLEVERYDKQYFLILEIMGRYSNSILINEDKHVLDAQIRLSKEKSKRELRPGVDYTPPPPQDKLNPLEVDKQAFFDKIPDDFAKYCFRALFYNFRGMGPDMAREIVYRAGIDTEEHYNQLTDEQKNKIWDSFRAVFQRVKQEQFQPTIGLDEQGEIDYFAAFPLTHKDSAETREYKSTGPLFDFYYQHHVVNRKFRELYRRLTDIVENYLKKNRKKQDRFRQQLAESRRAEEYKQIGELITANIYRMEKGIKEIKVEDFYSEDNRVRTIELNPELTPSENAQKYFKKYEKAKKSVSHLKKEIGKLRHEEKYLDQVLLNIEQAETREELQEIEDELRDEGYIKEQKQKENTKDQPLPPHKYKSSQGYDILVGRSNRQNDRLTKKMANSQDLWLHTKEIAGSHVIIRNHTGKEIPEQTIREAASLAAYYSKARMSENVPIDFTEVKHVNKPKGAKPGLVYYDNYQTIYVDPAKDGKI